MAIDMHRISASATALGSAKADVHRGVPRCSLLKRLIEGASISAIAIAAVAMASSNVRAAEPGAFTISAHDGASETVTGVQILSNRAIEATGAGSGVNLNDADVTVGIENPTDTTNARAGLQVTDGASANVVTSTLRTDGTLDYAKWQSSYWDDTAVDVSGNGSIATFTDSSIVAGADAVGVSGTGASVTLTNTNVQAGTFDAPTGYNGPGKGVAVRDGASATIEGGSITTSGSATQYWHGGAESPTGVPNNIVDKPLFRHSAQDGDSAIYVRGEGSNVDATDVVIQVAGSPGNNTADTSVNTRAVIALGGAQATLTGGSITTTGDARTTGVYVQAYSNLDGWLEDPRNADTSVTLNDVSIITEGAETGVGVKAYSNTKTADGLAPDGSDPHTQTVYINGGSISTSGEESYGLVAQNYGSTILADTWNGTGLAIDTAGVNAHGVVVYGAAEADLTGASVTTTGAGALGVSVNVMGPLSAPSSSPSAGGALSFNEGSIVTSGAQAMGAFARGAATATIGGTDIATTGDDAIGLLLMDGAMGSLDNSSVTTSGDAAHAVGVADGASITITRSSLRADGADSSGVAMLNSANVEISGTEIASSGASFLSMLEQAGQLQDITLADGVVAVENDGTLLRINRNVDGADGIVDLRLSDGANAAGDILDLDAKAGNGHSSVSVTTGAQYAGLIDGVRSLDATGGTAILADGSALDRITAGVGGVIEATNVTLRTSGKKEDAAVADGGNIQINGGTISTDYRRGPGGGNAGINTHALLAVNGGLITGSDLVISGSNDGYFDGVVSVKAGSEIALSNSTISNEMLYSDFSAAGATADGEGAVLRLDGTSVSVASDKRTIGSSAGAIGVTNGGTIYINQGTDAVPAGERDQIAASGNWVRGIVAANGAGNLVDASNVAITTDGDNAYGVQVGAGGVDTGSSVVLHFSGIHTVGANAHGVYVASSDGGPALFTGEGVDVETSGQGAYAVVADGAGSAVTLAGGTVTTAGDWTYGLLARGAGSIITSSADVTTAGEWAFGAYADDGAQITLTGGTVTTNGFRAHGLLAEDGAVIDSAANVATLGDRAHGVQAGSYDHGDSTITLTGGSVSTAGNGAYGLLASFGGSITGAADIHTVGDGSFGASADGDGYINLTSGQITTEGNGSHGLLVVYDDRAQGAGVLDADVNVTTSGANAVGVLALDGGTANLTGGVVTTTGAGSFGIAAIGAFPGASSSPSSVTANQLTVTTSGAGAHAVSVADGAAITIANATLRATGAGSSGVAVQNSADVTIADTEIISSGATFASSLTQAGQVQNITLASGVVAVENDGTLLLVNRADDGGDGVVNFHLEAGSTTKGDILDLDAKTEGYSSVTVAAGADFNGRVRGVRDFQSDAGSRAQFTERVEVEGDINASGSSYVFSDEGAEIGGDVSLENDSSTTGGTIENRIHVAGNVSSDETSRMGGNWQIEGNLDNSGTVTPGNSIGIVSVAGNLNLSATSVYEAEVNQLGQSDRIEVGGIAYLDGSVEASALGGYLVHTPYTILTADGGFAGTEFQNVTWAGSNVFVAPVLSYDPNTVYLSFERSSVSFAQLGSTANQQAAAHGLDGYGFDNDLAKALAFAPVALAPAALDQLSGEVHASAKAALVEESHFLRDAVGNHLRAAFNGDDTTGAAAGSWWGYGFGSWSRFDSTAETARVKSSVGGFLMGIDGALAANWRLGLVGGYSRTSLHIDDRASAATSNNYHLGIYTGADVDGVNLSASVAHTWHKLKTSRSVAFDTFSDPSLANDYKGRTLQAFGEVSYDLGKDDLVLMPYANLAYVRLHANDRLEKGSEAALGAASQNMETLFTTLGVKLSSTFDLGGVQAKPSGRLGWRHAFNDIRSDARQHFVDAGDFTVQGAPIAKDAATIEAGIDFAVSTRATLGISYQGQFGSGVQANGLKAMLDVRF